MPRKRSKKKFAETLKFRKTLPITLSEDAVVLKNIFKKA